MPRANYVIPPKDGKVYVLDNDAVERLLPIEALMDAMEDSLREWDAGNAAIRTKKSVHVLNPEEDTRYAFVSFDGGVQKLGIYAIRLRSDLARGVGYRPPGSPRDDFIPEGERQYCGLVLLLSSRTGLPLALLPDGYVQHARVAACAGVAAKYLARQDSQVLGVLGSQWMARLHIPALCAVRPISQVKVYSPNREHREAFAREMAEKLDIEVEARESAEEVVRESDIVACCTDSRGPVFDGAWLEKGAYVCSVLGGEIAGAHDRIDYVVRHQPLIYNEALGAAGSGERPVGIAGKPPEGTAERWGSSLEGWSFRPEAPILSEVIVGKARGRADPNEIIYFSNNEGTGIQFATAGAVILANLERSGSRGVNSIPLDWLLQDMPD